MYFLPLYFVFLARPPSSSYTHQSSPYFTSVNKHSLLECQLHLISHEGSFPKINLIRKYIWCFQKCTFLSSGLLMTAVYIYIGATASDEDKHKDWHFLGLCCLSWCFGGSESIMGHYLLSRTSSNPAWHNPWHKPWQNPCYNACHKPNRDAGTTDQLLLRGRR